MMHHYLYVPTWTSPDILYLFETRGTPCGQEAELQDVMTLTFWRGPHETVTDGETCICLGP